MVSAPSVSFPVGRCRFYAWALLALAVSGLAVLGVWVFGVEQRREWPGWLGAAAWMLWLVFAAWSWWRSPVGHLRWDATAPGPDATRAGAWMWRSASSPEGAPLQRVEWMVDLQTHVLLCLHSADALTRWVWVERGRDPARWRDLRCALVAHT